MLIHADLQLGDPPIISDGVSAILICDRNRNPLAVFIERDGVIFQKNASEDDFTEVLKQFGIRSSVQYRLMRPALTPL